MADFELKYIYSYIINKTKIFLRLIDDLFMPWTGSEQELLNFMSDLNKDPSIKLEFKYSQTKIEFLDVLVYKDQNNMLQKTIYMKQTDRQNYLHARSAKMINRFQKRIRETTTFERKKKDTPTNAPLSLKYNRTLPKTKEIIMEHWNLLHINPSLAEIFQNPPILAPPVPIPDKEKKIKLSFYFHTSLWCLKGFMKALKAVIKPFEAPQRSGKVKI